MRRRWPIHAVLGVAALGAAGCFRVPQRSATLTTEHDAPEVTTARLQMWVFEAGRRFSAIVEATADTIAARSGDPAIGLRSIRWKAAAVPLIEEASLRPEPVVAGVDLWLFTMQHAEYLKRGDGRDAFGLLQPLAIAAADTLVQLAAEPAGRVRPGGTPRPEDVQALRDWADRHPIRGVVRVMGAAARAPGRARA